jgi:hypothetical protein
VSFRQGQVSQQTCFVISTSQFAAYRENYREFRRIWPARRIFGVQLASKFNGLPRNSLLNRTGNFRRHNREFFRDNRGISKRISHTLVARWSGSRSVLAGNSQEWRTRWRMGACPARAMARPSGERITKRGVVATWINENIARLGASRSRHSATGEPSSGLSRSRRRASCSIDAAG